MLLADGLFGAGMISSYLKLIHIFSINPHLGPLQVSLGKMMIDIAKFLVLYILVLFSFGCGMNNLLWYYADLERQQCYSLPDGGPDWEVRYFYLSPIIFGVCQYFLKWFPSLKLNTFPTRFPKPSNESY